MHPHRPWLWPDGRHSNESVGPRGPRGRKAKQRAVHPLCFPALRLWAAERTAQGGPYIRQADGLQPPWFPGKSCFGGSWDCLGALAWHKYTAERRVPSWNMHSTFLRLAANRSLLPHPPPLHREGHRALPGGGSEGRGLPSHPALLLPAFPQVWGHMRTQPALYTRI